MQSVRVTVQNALQVKFSEKRAKAYEKILYDVLKKSPDFSDEYYLKNAYEILAKLFDTPNEEHEAILKKEDTYFTNKIFDFFDNKRKIENNRFINPPQLAEGTSVCKKCKGKRTIFHQLQTRSIDEAMTSFYTCMNQQCGHKWKE